MSSPFVTAVESLLGVDAGAVSPVGGGCVSDAHRIELADGRVVFAKSGARLPEGLLAVEAEGLGWLREANAVRIPEVVALGTAAAARPGSEPAAEILVLEWVESGPTRESTAERLGHDLARLHATGAPGFGWHRDGFIGPLPQRNTPLVPAATGSQTAWPNFWFTRRIEPLARLAHDGRSLPPGAAALVARLGERLPDLAGPPEQPARLHGDLWSGNVMIDRDGEPWVVDPAPYGGHREVDIAMLHLFGRPAPATLDAYDEVWPLADGWRQRLSLWQLEPLLVHAVLFGGSYGGQAHDVLRRFS